MAFKSEQTLLKAVLKNKEFIRLITSEGSDSYYQVEPEGLFGVPDLVFIRVKNPEKNKISETWAFELKLSNWKRALVQAYRYKSFANRSFVLMDGAHVKSAVRNIRSFRKVGIGLLSLDSKGNLSKHYYPKRRSPFSKQLRDKHKEMVVVGLNKDPIRLTLERLRLKLVAGELGGFIAL